MRNTKRPAPKVTNPHERPHTKKRAAAVKAKGNALRANAARRFK
jgi:hypothetical protein